MLTRIFSKLIILAISASFLSQSIITAQASREPARGLNGMVVSENLLASEIGLNILKKGGNAIDAAVAVGFALAVTYPEAGNIGGGGFMIIHFEDGQNTSIDFRETAPAKSSSNMFLNEEGEFDIKLSTRGWTSSGVPGTVAGLTYALKKYGTMNISEVIQPAIDLAENGFAVEYPLAEKIERYFNRFSEYKSTVKVFTDQQGGILREGDLLVQKDLAKTLRLIKENGSKGFYEGETAELIAGQAAESGGYITEQDLSAYQPVELEPIIDYYREYEIISMPPSSSGGIALVESLNALENFSFQKDEWNGAEYIHTLVEILKRVYADRSKHLGDEKFYDVPREKLLSKEYGRELADSISYNAKPSASILPSDFTLYESDQTTHYNVADKYGNAVSVTYTINGLFGNKIIVDGAGFFMNNEMDDFSSQPGKANQFGLIGGEANSIQPGKRMLSSMTPTIVLRHDKPYLLLGGRGGSKIITSVLQVLLNVLDFDMNIKQAVSVPRFHHQWFPDKIDYNEFAIDKDTKNNLISRGHTVGEVEALAKVLAILIDKEGVMWGASDPRGEGQAIGY